MTNFEADVCIVGSGVAGAIVAKKCLDAGLTVVMVEAGKYANGRAFGLRVLEKMLRDYRIPRMRLWHRDALYAPTDDLNPSYPVRGRALVVRGGTTLGWTGDAYRMMPEDFEALGGAQKLFAGFSGKEFGHGTVAHGPFAADDGVDDFLVHISL